MLQDLVAEFFVRLGGYGVAVFPVFWLVVHWLAEPNTEISLLFGAIRYTKRSPKLAKQKSPKTAAAKRPAAKKAPAKRPDLTSFKISHPVGWKARAFVILTSWPAFTVLVSSFVFAMGLYGYHYATASCPPDATYCEPGRIALSVASFGVALAFTVFSFKAYRRATEYD